MIKMNRRSVLKASAATAAVAALPATARAYTPSYTPADLKGVLTPFGSLRAGNADGSIPAWTGGYTTVSPDYVPGQLRPIPPILNDSPLFSITASNVTQYQDKLTPGQLALFQKYPDFRMDVYKTNRTASAPQYVYDYITKNASNAQLTNDGNAVANAYGGIPFPIPTDGHQVIWNHLLAWAGTTFQNKTFSYTVTQSGEVVLEVVDKSHIQYPYYIENGESTWNGVYLESLLDPVAPPYEAGGFILERSPLNAYLTPVQAYEYLVGERRVRSAPELQYDTPNSLTGGTVNWDEFNIFSGKLDEYDCNYLGVKEMYVPYNCNKAWSAPQETQFQPHFVNPDLTRWELHRVRIVEMTVKSSARNVDARRLVYTDEDGGAALLGEIYDAQNTLWKFQHMVPAVLPDIPCHVAGSFFVTYDLHSGVYSCNASSNSQSYPSYQIIPELPNSYFTPGELTAQTGGF
jgi:hypothetical protein